MATKSTLADRTTREQFRTQLRVVATRELGKHETPPGSNRTPYGAWYGLDGMPWCAQFVSWCYVQAATAVGCENPLAGVQSLKGFAHVTSAWETMRRRGWTLRDGERPMTGDIVCWDHDEQPGGAGHTGLVVRVNGETCDVIEGNTDGSFSRTGGNVMLHVHDIGGDRHGRLLGYARPTRSLRPVSRLDHWSHAGWVAVWCDTELLGRLRAHQADGESVHDTVRRMVTLGLKSSEDV